MNSEIQGRPQFFNSREISSPFHLFFPERALEDARALSSGLRAHLPKAHFFYSTKTNGLIPLLRGLRDLGWGLEIVCPLDLEAAALSGARGHELVLNGAAWTKPLLQKALWQIMVGQVTVDSLSMAQRLAQILGEAGSARPPLRIALRIHDGDSHFGFPPQMELIKEALGLFKSTGTTVFGLHLHRNPHGSSANTESMDADFRWRCERLTGIASHLEEIKFLDLGGGIDSPWVYRIPPAQMGRFHHPKECEALRKDIAFPRFCLKDAGERISFAVKNSLGVNFGRWEIQFEPGRAVCSRALNSIVEVKAVKKNLYPDGNIIITDGNTAFLGPLHRAIHGISTEQRKTTTSFVYGNLPHSGDWLFQSVLLPDLQIGERIQIENTGAYFLALEAGFGFPKPGIYDGITGEILRAPKT